jgi:hypothetical protein
MKEPSLNPEKSKSDHQKLYAIPLQVEEKIAEPVRDIEEKPDLRGFGPSTSDIKVAISDIIDRFCTEVSQSLEDKNLKWEAEIELGVDFGFAVKTKIKISPKS